MQGTKYSYLLGTPWDSSSYAHESLAFSRLPPSSFCWCVLRIFSWNLQIEKSIASWHQGCVSRSCWPWDVMCADPCHLVPSGFFCCDCLVHRDTRGVDLPCPVSCSLYPAVNFAPHLGESGKKGKRLCSQIVMKPPWVRRPEQALLSHSSCSGCRCAAGFGEFLPETRRDLNIPAKSLFQGPPILAVLGFRSLHTK